MDRTLTLANNQLSGPLPMFPDAFNFMQSLVSLDLSHNQLSGAIGDALTGLQFLHTLDVSYNRLSGTFPNSISTLVGLTSLNAASNAFTGGFANLALLNVVALDLSYNTAFTESLPDAFSSLVKLSYVLESCWTYCRPLCVTVDSEVCVLLSPPAAI